MFDILWVSRIDLSVTSRSSAGGAVRDVMVHTRRSREVPVARRCRTYDTSISLVLLHDVKDYGVPTIWNSDIKVRIVKTALVYGSILVYRILYIKCKILTVGF